ncbi:hypothetical protein LWI28_018096 [Acer negundo]|uniref:RING-type E3 ubiquitin transferase n=1 Tax=Acer negundo TaxID=4023 RepID=A0AAD5NSF8_ACENE|nr:hypothetical protein LWI28_018096 [Acer negundo]KAK4851491.1 hypothetical protein QYF36_015673 [Acer negundo]
MKLQFHHRKLLDDDPIEDCLKERDSSDVKYTCKNNCYNPQYQIPQPTPPPPSHHPSKPGKFLIISVTLLASAFLAVCFYAIYVKLYLGSRRRRSRSDPQTINQTHDDFVDQDHGPTVDHHIWYIHTVGLQPSVISSITVCKYKSGDGLIEGTECSVCLSDFQEDETLRLLPKCNHAFHPPCIDTWLRSHTNCPMCRAPIIKNSSSSSPSSSSSSNSDNSDSRIESGDAQTEVFEENGETEPRFRGDDQDFEEEMVEVGLENTRKRSEDSSDEMQPMRRSVSLDFLSASKISEALANTNSNSNSNTHLAEDSDSESRIEIVGKRVGRNDSLARFVATSSIRRTLSCSGKLLLSKSSGRGRDSN